MENHGGTRSCGEKRAPDDYDVANKKQRTERFMSKSQLQDTKSSGQSEPGNQLVPYQHLPIHTLHTENFECSNHSKIELYSLMVKNISRRCTAVTLNPIQPERMIHIILESAEASDEFVQPLVASGLIEVDKIQDTYYFGAARDCIVTVGWVDNLDHKDDMYGYVAGLEQLSNNKESTIIVLTSGKATNAGVKMGQVVPIGNLISFSNDVESRTSLLGPTFNTFNPENKRLMELLHDQTRPDVWYRQRPSAVCMDTSQNVRCSVVIDRHPIFLRKLLEHFRGNDICVIVAINEDMEHNGAMDHRAMQNAITMLHTFLAAGIDTVFPQVGLVRKEHTETTCRQLCNTAHTDRIRTTAEIKSPTSYQLPETPDSQRQTNTTKDIPPSVEPALISSNKLTDILLLEVAKRLLASDAIDLGVALGQERRKAKNLVNSCGQQSDAAAVQEVLHAWRDSVGRNATPNKLIDALRVIEKTDVADLVLSRVTMYS
ncbi:uncharacterized protein LOC118413025 isoform X1 [Branchiostoma floridae]|uniref:Uncharacterized protein LOC118413025 isoform X1 n=1 Tax=Branchiostoma floridae TaxID=7739 RepID=A0A9J7MLX1_BRAFL|nr:uncharacterized protein LOC118413025 isoform X1 [Branchiostoma floridae]